MPSPNALFASLPPLQRLAYGLKRVAVVLLCVYLGLCLLLFLFQRHLLYHPQPRADVPGTRLLTLPVNNAKLNVTILERESPDAVLYFGGNAEDVSLNVPDLAAAFPGASLFLMHYRSYGGSSGTPSEAALVADALALFDKVSEQHPHITVIGRSLGSGVAIQVASQRPIARLVMVTPYDSIEAIAAQQFPYFPVHWLLRDKFESWRYADKVSAPTTILAAEHDQVIPASNTQTLLAHFRPNVARLVIIRNTDHNSISDQSDYIRWLGLPH